MKSDRRTRSVPALDLSPRPSFDLIDPMMGCLVQKWSKDNEEDSFIDDSEAETDASFLADSSDEDARKKGKKKRFMDSDDDASDSDGEVSASSDVDTSAPRTTRGATKSVSCSIIPFLLPIYTL